MLELKFTFIQNELDHDAWDECQGNCCHEHEVISTCCLFYVNKLLVDWEWLIDDVELKVRISCSNSQNGLIHVLGEHGSRVW